MSRCRTLIFSLLATLLYATTGVNSSQYSSNMFLNGQYQNGAKSQPQQFSVNPASNIFLEHAIISRQASPFQGPTYLPPKEFLKCSNGQQCVRQNQCQNGYYTQQLPKIQNCEPDTDICCAYRPPPTQASSTQRPYVTCGRDSDCVPQQDCRNGEIFAIDYIKKSTSDRCYAPEVCCRMPSTTLTNDGYIFNVPDKKFPIPTNPTVPQRTTQRPYPQPTQGPQPTQPSYQSQPTQPTYRPQPTQSTYRPQPTQSTYRPQSTQPTYRPQPTQPTYRPQPTQSTYRPQPTQSTYRPQQPTQSTYRQPTQTTKLSNEYLPPTSTQQTYRPQPQPQTTQQTYRPQPQPQTTQQTYRSQPQPQTTQQTYRPQPQSTQQTYRPQPQPQSTQQTYRPQPQPQSTQQTYRPQPQPQTTKQTFASQPTQPTYRQPQTTKLSNEYLPPTRPTQPPQRPTSTQYRPTQPPRQPQTTPNNQYLPPDSENEISSRPKYPSHQPDREPQPSNVKPIRGEDVLSPSIPNPNKFNFNNNPNQITPSKHFAKCASALLCTDESYCNSIGVINETPVILSPMEQAFRVPLTDCVIEESGAAGKCCRDSNYVDPWPVNLAGVCATINKNTKPVGIQDIDTNFAQIPWQVMILKESSKTLLCGGAIIGDEFVLTTAACVNGLSVSDAKIKAGEWELGRTEEPLPFQLLGAKSIELHPEYNPSTGANNMAIIRLEKRLEFATHIKPICISDKDPSPSEHCVTTGWGKQALQIHEEGAIMHVTDTTVAARSECGADATSVCSATKFDACQFDSGSALACGTGSSVLLKGIFAGENACGEGQAVRFSKPDVKWINTHFAVKNKPFLLKRF